MCPRERIGCIYLQELNMPSPLSMPEVCKGNIFPPFLQTKAPVGSSEIEPAASHSSVLHAAKHGQEEAGPQKAVSLSYLPGHKAISRRAWPFPQFPFMLAFFSPFTRPRRWRSCARAGLRDPIVFPCVFSLPCPAPGPRLSDEWTHSPEPSFNRCWAKP